ncbi:amino acid adenylation domain-containing protein [Sorangium sp. So ce1036]|uniref:amino acid adenylation domain-containing protein n=1 Tax=Sorangium sp. So ce1036 TaxID=3133328 RepID=UPI003F107449
MSRVEPPRRPDHLAAYLEASAARVPDRVAVVDVDGAPLTFATLDDRAERVAAFLRSRGVGPGDRVGFILSKGAAALAVLFGALKAGAAYVPIDAGAPAERNRAILAGCGVRALFALPRNLEALVAIAPPALPETVVVVPPPGGGAADDGGAPRALAGAAIPFCDVLAHARAPLEGRARRASDLACILYTSGSTGVPKGVMITHESAVSFVEWCSEVFALTPEDRFSSHAPLHFDLSVFDIHVSLKHGAQVHLIPEDVGQDPRALARFIADRRLTVWYSAPSVLALMAQLGGLERVDASALRLVLFAGEVFPVRHLRRLVELWPGPEYYNLYGPTETNVCTFARVPTPIPQDRIEPYPIGDPCSHCAALVLDQEGRPVEAGGCGLLYISGPSVFAGYWGAPDETAARFIERDGRRWFNTGDVVRVEPGAGYVYVGRLDRMVKRRGHRIELGEVESGLYRHEQTREAAVVAVNEPEGVRIVAFLVSRTGARPTLVELKRHCAAVLPSTMSPDAFLFLDALPRTSTGKVDYQALARLVPAGAGEPNPRSR